MYYMEQIVKRIRNGVSITLDHTGKNLELGSGQSVILEDCVGARVHLSVFPDSVFCEARVPESGTPVIEVIKIDKPRTPFNDTNLEDYISSLRIALNGKL